MQDNSVPPTAADTNEVDRAPRAPMLGVQLAKLRPDLYRFALSLTKDPASADDLVQDTLVKAFGAEAQFRNGTDLRAWSRTIMRNAFLDARRKRGGFCALGQDMPGELPERAIGPRDVLTSEDIRAAAAMLDPETREIFTLACFEHVPYREIAIRFHMAPATVGTRLLRTRFKLRRQLQEIFEQRVAALSAGHPEPGPAAAPLPLHSSASRHVVRPRPSGARATPAGRERSRTRARPGGPLGREGRADGDFSGNKQASQR
jgi:RNA polymerase sigma-70 factor, ECF subfamily